MNAVTVQIRRLLNNAIVPRYMTDHAAGLDLCAALDEEVTLLPGCRILVPTGLAMAIPVGYEGQVRPRSGLALNLGVTLVNSPGTIDADYRGEIGVIMINHGENPFLIKHGDRIAQLLIAPVTHARLQVVDNLNPTDRGEGALVIPESETNKKMPIADPNELIEFPSDYLFKAFCAKDAVTSFRLAVKHAVNTVMPCVDDAIKVRESSKGNYSCVTAMVRLENRAQLDAINTEIRKIESLLFML